MPLRRAAAVSMAFAAAVALAGCSGGDGSDSSARTPAATVTPTAVGDRPLVEVLDPGGEDRQRLGFDLAADTTSDATITIDQDVVTGRQTSQVPAFTVPFAAAVTGVDGDTVATTRTYARPTIDATGLRPTDVKRVRDALETLTGTTSELDVRRDGTTVRETSGVAAAAQVDAQVRALVPVFPTDEVGTGASWTATSVGDVDGATVDQVATYTLDSRDGDAYVIEVAIEQTYRRGEVEGFEVQSGRGTVTARLEGSLDRLVPDRATGDVSTQVSYVVDDGVTAVRTTVALSLTSA